MTSPPDQAKGSRERIDGLVEDLFRREWGRLVATLVRVFGPEHLALAEDVASETLLRALRRWPFDGIPDHPQAWLHRVARNLALDAVRRQRCFADKQAQYAFQITQTLGPEEHNFTGEITDDQLALIFACCQPSLRRASRIALTLKVAAGFSVREIASAFMQSESTIAQRLVRAKRVLRTTPDATALPAPESIPERMDSVLEVLFLIFNEGYSASEGDRLLRVDLASEALRLTNLLLAREDFASPSTHALAAMMYFHAARFPARVSKGMMVPLKSQNRLLWDQRLVSCGFHHLALAGNGDTLSIYHLHAGIAAEHVCARSFESTNWNAIISYYDVLVAQSDSPLLALNHAVATGHGSGPSLGLKALNNIGESRQSPVWHAAVAEFSELAGDTAAAIEAWQGFLNCAVRPPQRRYAMAELARLDGSQNEQ